MYNLDQAKVYKFVQSRSGQGVQVCITWKYTNLYNKSGMLMSELTGPLYLEVFVILHAICHCTEISTLCLKTGTLAQPERH